MSEWLTLIWQLEGDPPRHGPPPTGYVVRTVTRMDTTELARLSFDAYEPGAAANDLREAIADIEGWFDNAFGEHWLEASPVAKHEGEIAAAVLTVRRTPWNDAPDCPFIIEVFTHRSHRRRGLARHLVGLAADVVRRSGGSVLALRVSSDNRNALDLYRDLGFVEWDRSSDVVE